MQRVVVIGVPDYDCFRTTVVVYDTRVGLVSWHGRNTAITPAIGEGFLSDETAACVEAIGAS